MKELSAAIHSAVWATSAGAAAVSVGVTAAPVRAVMAPTPTRVSTPQSRSWVSPTSPMPMILPAIRSKGRTEETISSTMRFVFSSDTPCMTIDP